MLNAQEILNEDLIITSKFSHKAQCGVDLSVKSINKADETIGMIKIDKTTLPNYIPVEKHKLDGVEGWLLYNGVYEITMNEGCSIPENRVGIIIHRSSVYRNGGIITSPLFDPGFNTNNIGSFLYVYKTLFIEENARVAQMYFQPCNPVNKDNLYGGKNAKSQWQNDGQRFGSIY